MLCPFSMSHCCLSDAAAAYAAAWRQPEVASANDFKRGDAEPKKEVRKWTRGSKDMAIGDGDGYLDGR